MNEDKAIEMKLKEKKYKILQNPKAVCYHGHQYSFESLIKRLENEGFGWKCLNERYYFSDMLKDLFQPRWVYGALLRGIAHRQIRSPAEMLYIFLRPILIYKGNHFHSAYKF